VDIPIPRSLLSPLCGLNRPEYAEVEQEYPQWVCQLHFSYSENATADLYSIAQGYSGTGIGCFFDDTIHELIGLQSQSLQALYGFAVGEPLRDERVTQLTGYYHLRERFV